MPANHGAAKDSLLTALEWGLLLLALAAFTITEEYTSTVGIGFVLLLACFAVRVVRTRQLLPRTGLEIAWALGLLSGAVAAWISYDRSAALLQFARLLAAGVLYYAVVATVENRLRWPAGGFLAAAAALAIYWPLQYDFAAQPTKLALITRLGALINSLGLHIPGPEIHANVAAGTLLVAVPFGAGFAWDAWRRRQRWLAAVAVLLTLIVLGGLMLTGSRGAWLALVGTILFTFLAWMQRRWSRRLDAQAGARFQIGFWAAVAVFGLLAAAAILATGSFDRLVGQIPDPTGGIQSRTRLWQQGWQLARAAPFTGSGLMSFWMAHAVYGLLIDVPFIAHAHNTFLEVWVEQGILGFIGLLLAVAVAIAWAWKALSRQNVSCWGWAGLAALLAASLHGLVDVVFYVTRTLPVIGLLFGYAWFLNLGSGQSGNQATAQPDARAGGKLRIGVLLPAAIILLGLAVIIFWRPLRAAWYANLGVVQQTRLELTQYDPQKHDTITLDMVRRANIAALEPAQANFARALAIDPDNRTVLQRQAQIALSLGDYPAALGKTERLWLAGSRDDVTRLSYGDALVAAGQVDLAAENLRGLAWAEPRLRGQAWYRYWINQDYRRAADAWMTVLVLNPQAQDLISWLDQAKAKLK